MKRQSVKTLYYFGGAQSILGSILIALGMIFHEYSVFIGGAIIQGFGGLQMTYIAALKGDRNI